MSLQPPYARPVNTVFQDYALFPHMSIRDNVAYALMVRKVGKAERQQPRRRTAGAGGAGRRAATGGRRSCRAASASAWRWRAR